MNDYNRKRRILWCNPPFNMCVANNIGKEFKILHKNFPPTKYLTRTILN